MLQKKITNANFLDDIIWSYEYSYKTLFIDIHL